MFNVSSVVGDLLGRSRRNLVVLIAATLLAFLALMVPAPVSAEQQTTDDEHQLAYATVTGTGEQIAYEVIDGMAVVEHDILLGTHAEVQRDGVDPDDVAASAACPEGMECGVITTSSRRAWPDGVIPYTISPGTPSNAVANIGAAIDHWEQKTSIRFVERSNERDYVEFVGTGSGNVCSSYLGRAGGRQPINYAGNGRGCLVHEIGHAVGLSHEHNRNDRDQFIDIDFTNLSSGAASQFRIATGSTDVGAYDFNSVMHYSAYSFALDRSRPVITAKDGRDPRTIGGRGVLTGSDVEAVEFVYGTSPPPPPPPPTTTTPEPTTTTTEESTTTTTTEPPKTTTTAAPSTTERSTTTERPTTVPSTIVVTNPPTTEESTTTTAAPPTTQQPTIVTRPEPSGDRKPVIQFVSVRDGDTVATRVPYGGINLVAYDPDAGTGDGDGIRWVTLVLSDAETGRFLGARREYWSTYDWGLRLRGGRSYVLTAYAVSDDGGGRDWSQASITITAR